MYYRHFLTVTKRTGQDVFGVPPTRRGHSKTSWSGHGPDTRTLLRLSAARELSGCFDVREGQRQRRFNRWLRSLRDHNHLAKGGVVTARQGFAGAANAPLTGFHSKGRSHWSLASPSCPLNMATIRRCTSPSTLTNVLLTNAA